MKYWWKQRSPYWYLLSVIVSLLAVIGAVNVQGIIISFPSITGSAGAVVPVAFLIPIVSAVLYSLLLDGQNWNVEVRSQRYAAT